MKAVVFHGIGDIRLENISEPRTSKPQMPSYALPSGATDPTTVLKEEVEPFDAALKTYQAFDRRQPAWIKVELKPAVVPV